MRVAYVFLEAMFPFSARKSFKMSSEDVFFIICLLFFFGLLVRTTKSRGRHCWQKRFLRTFFPFNDIGIISGVIVGKWLVITDQ